MSYLEGLHNKVLKLWETKHEDYEEHLDSQKFKEDSEQAEAWIAAQDALLKDDDFGVREREKGREGGREKERRIGKREREKERRIEKKRRGEERKSGDNNEKRI